MTDEVNSDLLSCGSQIKSKHKVPRTRVLGTYFSVMIYFFKEMYYNYFIYFYRRSESYVQKKTGTS